MEDFFEVKSTGNENIFVDKDAESKFCWTKTQSQRFMSISPVDKGKKHEAAIKMSSSLKRTLAQSSHKGYEEFHHANKKQDGKVHRRISYKMANKPIISSVSPKALQPSSKRQSLENSVGSLSRSSMEVKSTKLSKSFGSQDKIRPVRTKSRRHSREKDSKSATSKSIDSSSNFKKFPESLGEPVHNGLLKSKSTFVDGKYSVDRAWKNTYAVLRGHCLCLHPDKSSQNLVVYDHPISIGSALVDIAYDYTKRSNVFRLVTLNFSEFLFEASSSGDMLEWIHMLQKQGLAYSEEFLRKRLYSATSSKTHKTGSSRQRQQTSSLDGPSPNKRDSLYPVNLFERFRSRSPEGQKFKFEGTSSSHESKTKSWKEKMVERFKRANSHPGTTPPSSTINGENSSSLLSSPNQFLFTDENDGRNGKADGSAWLGSLGVPLSACVSSSDNENLPLIVETCIKVIESKGLNNRGIYRVPGNSAAIATLQAEVEKDPVTLNREHEKWEDTNAVVSLLKLFFRKLPEPLVTTDLYQSFIEANRTEDKTKRLLKIKRSIHLLPPCNFETFKCLATHLNKVATFEKTNMMDARNLAIVFGPTLLQPAQDKNMVNMVKDMNDQCQIIESVITHFSWFFSSWDEDVQVPGSDTTRTGPVTSMETQLIEKAQQHSEISALNNSIKKNLKLTAVSPASSKIFKKETDTVATKGANVYSVESVYCDLENSGNCFDSKRNSKLRSSEKSNSSRSRVRGESSNSVRMERTSRKKIRDDESFNVSSSALKQEPVDKKVRGNDEPDEPRFKYVNQKDLNSDNKKSYSIKIEREYPKRESESIESSDTKPKSGSRKSDGLSKNEELSSRDSCFIDCGSEISKVKKEHVKRHLVDHRSTNKNVLSSSFLQPPRMHFRSRSAQKFSKRNTATKLSTTFQMDLNGSTRSEIAQEMNQQNAFTVKNSEDLSTSFKESVIPSGQSRRRSSEMRAILKSNQVTAMSLDEPSNHSGIDSFSGTVIMKSHRSVISLLQHHDAGDEIFSPDDHDIKVSDDVFDDGDNITSSVKKPYEFFGRWKRSSSLDSLFHRFQYLKILSALEMSDKPQHGANQSERLYDKDLNSEKQRPNLTLHSFVSPLRNKRILFSDEKFPMSPKSPKLIHPTEVQKKSNLNILKNLLGGLHQDFRHEHSRRQSTEMKNALKKLVRTISVGNLKEDLTLPSSPAGASSIRDTRGSLSYESSV